MSHYIRILIMSVSLIVSLSACGGKDYEYTSDDEKRGPGLFSGEDGVITIYDKPKNSKKDQLDEAKIE